MDQSSFLKLTTQLEVSIIWPHVSITPPPVKWVVEKKHQHLLGVTYVLIFKSRTPKILWSYDVRLINSLPSKLLNYKCLFTLLYYDIPDYSSITIFSSLVYACSHPLHRTKLDFRLRKCIYLGLKFGVKGSILYDISNRNIFLFRDTIYFEHIFPFKQNQHPSSSIP